MSPPATSGPGLPSVNPKEVALTLLGIPTYLSDHTDHGLHVAYQKYKAHLEASRMYDQMVSDRTWTGSKLSAVDLIELFVSKSYFHSHFKKCFSKVSDHPLMVEWLEGDPGHRPSDLDVWGVEKSVYIFKDLAAYLEQAAGKGKKKAKAVKQVGGNAGNKKKTKGGEGKSGNSSAKKQVK